MSKQNPEFIRQMIQSYFENLNRGLKQQAPVKPTVGKAKLRPQTAVTEDDIKRALVYGKKEIVEIRDNIRTLMRNLSELPTYQYIKPQVDELIKCTNDLEQLMLNRFDERRIAKTSPEEWEALQHIRQHLLQQLLYYYTQKK